MIKDDDKLLEFSKMWIFQVETLVERKKNKKVKWVEEMTMKMV